MGILGGITVGVYGHLFATNGIPTSWVPLSDVYDVRAEYIATTSGATLLGYLVPLQSNVINPVLITRGLYARNWPLFTVGVLGQVVVYLSEAQKGVLFPLSRCSASPGCSAAARICEGRGS